MQRSITMKTLLSVFLAILGAAAFAKANELPSNYSRCGQNINEPKDGSGYLWSHNCKTVYVLAPNRMKIDVNVEPDPDVSQLCGEVWQTLTALDTRMGQATP